MNWQLLKVALTAIQEAIAEHAAELKAIPAFVQGMVNKSREATAAEIAQLKEQHEAVHDEWIKLATQDRTYLQQQLDHTRASIEGLETTLNTRIEEANAATEGVAEATRAAHIEIAELKGQLEADSVVHSDNFTTLASRIGVVTESVTALRQMVPAPANLAPLEAELAKLHDLFKSLSELTEAQYQSLTEEFRTKLIDVVASIPEPVVLPEPVDLAPVHAAIAEVRALIPELPEPVDLTSLSEGQAALAKEHAQLAEHVLAVEAELNTRILAVGASIPELPEPVVLPEPVDLAPVHAAIAEVRDQLAAVTETFATPQDIAKAIAALPEPPAPVVLPEPVDLVPLQNQLVELRGELAAATEKFATPQDIAKAIASLPEPPAPVVLPEPVDLAPVHSAIAEVRAQLAAAAEQFATPQDIAKAIASLPEPPAPVVVEPVDLAPLELAVSEVRARLDDFATPADIAKAISNIQMPVMPDPMAPQVSLAVDLAMDVNADGTAVTVKALAEDRTELASVEIPLPVAAYRGVYDKKTAYAPGNMVTHDGSIWVAQKANPGEPKTDLVGWKLAVKCGRNGRDGKDGENGRSVELFVGHQEGRHYRKGDFLHLHNRAWQCRLGTVAPPERAQGTSSDSWAMLGYIQ